MFYNLLILLTGIYLGQEYKSIPSIKNIVLYLNQGNQNTDFIIYYNKIKQIFLTKK